MSDKNLKSCLLGSSPFGNPMLDENDEPVRMPGDLSYSINVTFDMAFEMNGSGLATPGNSANSGDYHLEYLVLSENSLGETVETWNLMSGSLWTQTDPDDPENTTYAQRYTVTIPAGETSVIVRLVAHFDWEDEGELFDPFNENSTTPWNDLGEMAPLEIVNVTWTGKPAGYDAIDHDNSTAEVEIKDGAIMMIMVDANNDGTIDYDDYVARRGEVGSLLLKKSTETAEYYAWIDEPGSHVFDVKFQDNGGVRYADLRFQAVRDYIFEDDETIVMEIHPRAADPSSGGGHTVLDGAEQAEAVILQAPEFISDVDGKPHPNRFRARRTVRLAAVVTAKLGQ